MPHDTATVPDSPARVRWFRRLRWYGVVAIVLVVALGLWFLLRPDGESSATVTTTKQLVTVTRGPLTSTVTADGTADAAQTDELSFTSSGTVTAVSVAAGDKVTAGQVLATMDSASLAAAVSSAASDLASAEATLSDAQSSGASSAQIEADASRVQTATDALANAQEALAGASLVATFDGTVASVNVTAGEKLGNNGSGGTDQTGSASGSGGSSSTLGDSTNAAAAGWRLGLLDCRHHGREHRPVQGRA